MKASTISNIQQILLNHGLYEGRVDGIFGDKTTAAVMAYQRLNLLPITGLVNPALMRMLEGNIIRSRLVDETPRPVSIFPSDNTKDLTAFYGAPGTTKFHQRVKLPYKLELAWQPGTFIDTITLHELCAEAFKAVFQGLLNHYGLAEIARLKLDQFGGSYANRLIRGGARPSTHAFACAVDLNPLENQLRWNSNKAAFARPQYNALHECMADYGIVGYGKKYDMDYMHFAAVK